MASRHLRSRRKATNGIAERAIRRVREGTGASLVQAGMDPIWWGEACQCYCFLRVTRDILHPDGKTSFERRYDRPFTGPLAPFGAKVYVLPTNKDDCKLLHPMGSKTLPGIFAGYHQQVGGQWSGDVYVVPLVYIERNTQEKPHCRRIPAANMTMAKKKGHEKDPENGFIFPVRRIQENYGEELRPVSSDSSSSSSSSSDEESSSECSSKESAGEAAERET